VRNGRETLLDGIEPFGMTASDPFAASGSRPILVFSGGRGRQQERSAKSARRRADAEQKAEHEVIDSVR
jgi:hypothetical protein